jgi:O-6-methylguanine DNA methyltransferase
MFQTSLDTPVGPLVIEGTRDFITSIQYATPDADSLPAERVGARGAARDSTRESSGKSCLLLNTARRQLREYFAGTRKSFDLACNLSMGTEFQREVWALVAQVGYGETTTFAELARRVGRPTAQRAVGRAVAANPLMIVIPTHRVLSARRRMSGYRGGVKAKAWLLQHESAVLV